jgi:predicted transcriptional regulator of viral defense system
MLSYFVKELIIALIGNNSMQYVQLRHFLKDYTIFSLNDIRQLEPNFHRRRLNEWQEKGYIKKVVKEYYIFSDKPIDENALFEIANRIYKPSYISFEAALSFYQFIPESVYGITSASTRRTYTFHTLLGNFLYRTIKPDLFFGYEMNTYNGNVYKIAGPEKSVLDFLYLNRHMRTDADFESLRINYEIFFQVIDLNKLNSYSLKYSQKTLASRLNRFIRFLSDQKEKINA